MHKTISVYFSGTDFSILDSSFLASRLYLRTEESDSQIKMGFNGCGVDYGFLGTIFGSGLDEQCDKVIDRIKQELNTGHQITLNVYGHSRGGIAALLLAKQLGNIDKERLAINLALLDPVPGNFVTTAIIDPFKISLASKTMDLSDCKPLRKVLALYPYVPLPAIYGHAPLLVSYPQDTEVQEEVVTGCHAQTEKLSNDFAELVVLRVEEFLAHNGTNLDTNIDYNNSEVIKRTYLRIYQQALTDVSGHCLRETHSSRGVMISAIANAKYLNSRHKALAGDDSQAPVSLSIQPAIGFFAWCRKFFNNYPLIAQALKWTSVSLSLTALLYFTGGLAVAPMLASVVMKLGSLSILACAPMVGGTLTALWYGAVKPILSWCANKYFYPHYSVRKIELSQVAAPDSTRRLMDVLGVERLSADDVSTVSLVSSGYSKSFHTPREGIDDELESEPYHESFAAFR